MGAITSTQSWGSFMDAITSARAARCGRCTWSAVGPEEGSRQRQPGLDCLAVYRAANVWSKQERCNAAVLDWREGHPPGDGYVSERPPHRARYGPPLRSRASE